MGTPPPPVSGAPRFSRSPVAGPSSRPDDWIPPREEANRRAPSVDSRAPSVVEEAREESVRRSPPPDSRRDREVSASPSRRGSKRSRSPSRARSEREEEPSARRRRIGHDRTAGVVGRFCSQFTLGFQSFAKELAASLNADRDSPRRVVRPSSPPVGGGDREGSGFWFSSGNSRQS